MSFSSQFLQNFSPVQQNSTMLDIVAKIGDTVEAEVHTEMQKLVADNIDPTSMSIDGCRKFLSYIFQPAANFTAANGLVSINIISATSLFTILAGSVLVSSSGEEYYNVNTLNLQSGQQLTFAVKQGFSKTVTGIYDTFISITDSNIDLSTISLSVNGLPINPVVTPLDGFMAFYFDGILYVKIFSGPDVPAVSGQSYALTYAVCDGQLGNINANTISSFQSPIYDGNHNLVTYTLSHDAFSNGFNAPALSELRASVKYWFYTKNTIVRISDYLAWFLEQQSVGDAYVYGDTEFFNMTGVLNITGLINIILVPANGGYFFQSDYANFNTLIAPYKDCAVLNYLTYTSVFYYFNFQFTASSDNEAFQHQISVSLSNYFNVELERISGRSLFGSFDLDLILKDSAIQSYKPQNLSIVPYYVDKFEDLAPVTSAVMSSVTRVNTIITAISLSSGGTGYSYPPTVVISGGGGAGATAVAILTGGIVTSVQIINGGSGYVSTPSVSFIFNTPTSVPTNIKNGYSYEKFAPKNGSIPNVTANISGGQFPGIVNGFNIIDGGSGYTQVPVIVLTVLPGHTGTGAEAVANLVNGVVDSITIITGGTGYDISPTVSFSGPNGSFNTVVLASVMANMNAGSIASLSIAANYGYAEVPTIVISAPGGAGTQATAHVVYSGISLGVLISIVIDNPGSGYLSPPTVTVVGGTLVAAGQNYSILFDELQTAVEGLFNIEDPLGNLVGTHNYNTNSIAWTVLFPKGELEIFSELLNRSYLLPQSFLCVRQLLGFEATVISLVV